MTHDEKLMHLTRLSEDSVLTRKATVEQLGSRILDVANLISGVIGSGGKLMIAGNGGSASQASHFAAELVVRLTSERNRQALPAIALVVDPSVLTAAANDFGYDAIFARQVEAIGHKGDMLILLSTSGNSPNLIKAAQVAREKGIITLAMLGGTGGKLGDAADRSVIVPHRSTQRIQEEHLFMIHTLVEFVEQDLFA